MRYGVILIFIAAYLSTQAFGAPIHNQSVTKTSSSTHETNLKKRCYGKACAGGMWGGFPGGHWPISTGYSAIGGYMPWGYLKKRSLPYQAESAKEFKQFESRLVKRSASPSPHRRFDYHDRFGPYWRGGYGRPGGRGAHWGTNFGMSGANWGPLPSYGHMASGFWKK